ncbi:lipoprotein-anchoring transpeptidase ErfK/SrfK [Bradyrhizobium sp. AZCC 1588]
MRVSGHRFFSASTAGATISMQRFWQIATLTAAGSVAAVSQADAAAMFYWQDSDPGYYRPMPMVQPRKPKVRRPSAKTEAAIKETNAKPQGPLIIAISIEQQKVRVYDANGLFAESPVSTGVKGHPTPMGVFSIIQKHKMHRSNIYSGAPMPYMQRITWSGIALHAGVLPGYPASHGCIRMPTAFAMKMWNWTRMGARVIITPGQITPASFSHPLLVTQKVVPQPLIADDPTTDAPAVKGDKGADAGHADPSLELRSTVGHAAPLREQTHTADAGSTRPTSAVVTMSDATPVGDTSSAEAKADAPKSEPAVSAADETTKAIVDTPAASVVAPEVKKDSARLPGADKGPRAEPPRRPGLIAVFVSRKDSKLYVRETFKPQFDLPVTIAPSDRPLGTHVFTVEADKNDPNLLRWSVVSLPVTARNAARIDNTEPAARRGRMPGAAIAEAKLLPAANSPAEALDRIAIAPEAIARIAEMLTTGSSIVVSDHGINTGGETGEGTDFIVPLRMVQP